MATTPFKALVIEDDHEIRRFLHVSLKAHGYASVDADHGAQGLALAASQPFDFVLLDLGLPDIDGIEVIRRLRDVSPVPIIILSARGQERDKIAALDAGADDYLTKPFGVGELLARIRVALRHRLSQAEFEAPTFHLDALSIDFASRVVKVGDEQIHLTPTEFRILGILTRSAGKVVTHRQLLTEVWGPDSLNEAHSLRVYIGRLREKIELDTTRPRYFLTEPGVGYRLAAE